MLINICNILLSNIYTEARLKVFIKWEVKWEIYAKFVIIKRYVNSYIYTFVIIRNFM